MVGYGTDKPDLRNPLRAVDLTREVAGMAFPPFETGLAEHGVVRALRVPGHFLDVAISIDERQPQAPRNVSAKRGFTRTAEPDKDQVIHWPG